ncbi:MAG TPA: aldehyde dehydrogenase family protein, partial [Chitinophagaceae bacterium]|nr:aldehyde dehydrogenase family protein [Chitinophagaceae bacterium]
MEGIAKLETLRRYFDSGATRSYDFRREQLEKLKRSILEHEQDLYDALRADLNKSPEETWVTETGLVIAELNAALKHFRNWMKPEKVSTNLLNMPSGSRVMKEPLGV